MLEILVKFLLASSSLFIVACTAYSEKNDIQEPGALDLILCEEPRPQLCTMEYDPVCATLSDGSTTTGATGCSACSDPNVVGYKKGEC
jgi:hypothetical protein